MSDTHILANPKSWSPGIMVNTYVHFFLPLYFCEYYRLIQVQSNIQSLASKTFSVPLIYCPRGNPTFLIHRGLFIPFNHRAVFVFLTFDRLDILSIMVRPVNTQVPPVRKPSTKIC